MGRSARSVAHAVLGSRRRRWVSSVVRVVTALCAGIAMTAVLSLGMPPRTPDFIWRGASETSSPVPPAATALRSVAEVLRLEFGLPLPPRLVARAYGSRDGFARGLITYAFVEPGRAAELAGFAAGVALPGELLLREPLLADPTGDWVRLVAHELTHVAQIELAGGEVPAARWLGEGMAEWVAYSVLERTVPGALQAHRDFARPALCAALNDATLHLASLGTPEAFVRRAVSRGVVPTYHIAFALTDDLIGRVGLRSVRAYFGSFRESIDADANFVAAFGTSLAVFEREATGRAAMACAPPPAPTATRSPSAAARP